MEDNQYKARGREFRQDAEQQADRASWYMATGGFLAMAYSISLAVALREEGPNLPAAIPILFFSGATVAFLKSYFIATCFRGAAERMIELSRFAQRKNSTVMMVDGNSASPHVRRFRNVVICSDVVAGLLIATGMVWLLCFAIGL